MASTSSCSTSVSGWLPGRSGAVYATAGVVGALLLVGSLVLHELAHAVVARKAGTRVEDMTVSVSYTHLTLPTKA